jgi:hypothetical protein
MENQNLDSMYNYENDPEAQEITYVDSSDSQNQAVYDGESTERGKFSILSIFFIVLSVVMILTFFAILNYRPFGYSKTYSIDVGTENDTLPSMDAYLENEDPKGRISDPIEADRNYRKLTVSPVYFNLNELPLRADADTTVQISVTAKLNTGLKITSTDRDDSYEKVLYLPEVEKYHLVSQNTQYTLYSEKEIAKTNQAYIDVIDKNYKDGEKIYIAERTFDRSIFANQIPKIDSSQITVIDTPLRTNKYTLYSYFTEKAEIEVCKKDRDNKAGPDTLEVRLYDIKGNRLNTMILLDNDDPELEEEQKNMQCGVLKELDIPTGLYTIKIHDPSAENDSEIHKITVNSPKLVFEGLIEPLRESTIYMNPVSHNSLNVKTSHVDGLQVLDTVYYVYPNTPVALDSNYEAEKVNGFINLQQVDVEYQLKESTQSIKSEKGNFRIYGDGYMAFSEASLFDPFEYLITEDIEHADYILIGEYYNSERNGDWITMTQEFKASDLIKQSRANMPLYSWTLSSIDSSEEAKIFIDKIEIRISKQGVVK